MIRATLALFSVVALSTVAPLGAYSINNWWNDSDDIIVDEVFLPVDVWSAPAQYQMSEWNQVDVTTNDHPFLINLNPQYSFGANDGDNTAGFLDEAGLNSEYGLTFVGALAWTVCWNSGRIQECDVMLDSSRAWALVPDKSTWFQSTVLHELGHVRGLGHYNNFLAMQNSGTSKYKRDEINYMDDQVGVRQHAAHVDEMDVVMYPKWHDGSLPQWMSMSPTTVREGETVDLSGITVENRGTQAFGRLDFGIYLSTDSSISTGDQLLSAGYFSSFGTFTFSTFDWSVTMPTLGDCSTRYLGGIIDHEGDYAERFEGNNDAVFSDGSIYSDGALDPTALTILLAEDPFEQNDTFAAAAPISVPFDRGDLSIDQDLEDDYYVFTVSEAGTLDIDLLFSHAAGDIDLWLLDGSEVVLASSRSITDDEAIDLAVSAGTYTVWAEGYGTGSCNPYTLQVDFRARDFRIDSVTPAIAGQSNTWSVLDATPGGSVEVRCRPVGSFNELVVGVAVADANGAANVSRFVPAPAAGRSIECEAEDLTDGSVTATVVVAFS